MSDAAASRSRRQHHTAGWRWAWSASVCCALLTPVCLALAASRVEAQRAAPASGAGALAPFKRDLQAALREGLAQGPVEAIGACRLVAPKIARAHSREDIRVGRTSDRLRNPANTAPDWVAPILTAYLASPSDRGPRTVELAQGRTGYVEPILAQPLCLTCHGQEVAPELRARIEALYPEDQAVGFRAGDLRGVFWVELPAAE